MFEYTSINQIDNDTIINSNNLFNLDDKKSNKLLIEHINDALRYTYEENKILKKYIFNITSDVIKPVINTKNVNKSLTCILTYKSYDEIKHNSFDLCLANIYKLINNNMTYRCIFHLYTFDYKWKKNISDNNGYVIRKLFGGIDYSYITIDNKSIRINDVLVKQFFKILKKTSLNVNYKII